MSVDQLIYTDVPRGEGLDPKRAGYQIQACSPGLDAATQEFLAGICMHYGDAVYRCAPQSATRRELEWRSKTGNLACIPDEVLREFPIVWSYCRVQDGRYALTRVCYAGLTCDGRFGNFLAHVLVMPQDLLRRRFASPLSLRDSDVLLRPGARVSGTQLPTLDDQALLERLPPETRTVLEDPYRQRLADMASALLDSQPVRRPVLLCLQDWRSAVPLTQALLETLPPSVRFATSFCTFESDRFWKPQRDERVPGEMVSAHQLFVLCRDDVDSLGLRPEEYESRFTIFNFLDGSTSPQRERRAWASAAADYVLSGSPGPLALLHDLVERMGVAGNADACDRLTPLAGLFDVSRGPVTLPQAAATLLSVALSPAQAASALQTLLPLVDQPARQNDAAACEASQTDIAALVDLATTGADGTPSVAALRDLAAAALRRGDTRVTAALLMACGDCRQPSLAVVLRAALELDGDELANRPQTEADAAALSTLCLEALPLAGADAEPGLRLESLLTIALRAAVQAGCAPETWARCADGHVKPYFAGAWNKQKEELARTLTVILAPDVCPVANAEINLWRLEMQPPQGEALEQLLVEIIQAGSRTAAAETIAERVLLQTREACLDKPKRLALVLGRIADAAAGTPVADRLYGAFRELTESLKNDQRDAVYRDLARVPASTILCRAILDEILPWDAKASPKHLDRWRDKLLSQQPQVFDAFCHQVARRVPAETGNDTDGLLLAERLLASGKPPASPGPGWWLLSSALIEALPLAPLPPGLRRLAEAPAQEIGPSAAARLRAIQLVEWVGQRAHRPDWSTTDFPSDDPTLREAARHWSPRDRQRLVNGCMESFSATGVTTPDQARGLVRMLAVLGHESPEELAAAASCLLRNRDAVTAVLLATAFARAGVEGGETVHVWGSLLRAIIGRFSRTTVALFLEHLQGRFQYLDEKSRRQLLGLYQAAELPLPKDLVPREKQPSAPATTPETPPRTPRWRTFARRVVSGLRKLVIGR